MHGTFVVIFQCTAVDLRLGARDRSNSLRWANLPDILSVGRFDEDWRSIDTLEMAVLRHVEGGRDRSDAQRVIFNDASAFA